jgi:hypothetical protein
MPHVAEDARSNNFEEKMKADPVAVAVVLSGLNQPFDLSLGQVLRVRRSLLGAARVQVGIAQIHFFQTESF